MAKINEEVLQQMARAIVDEVDPEQVILFGSHARGNAHEDSDVDLIVIEAEPFEGERSRHFERIRVRKAIRDFEVPKDILVFSLEDVEYWRDSLNNVLARALREGKVLYERP